MKNLSDKGRLALMAGLAGLAVAGLLAACATTRNEAFVKVDGFVAQRQYDKAVAELDADKNKVIYTDQDKVVRYLDYGILRHLGGRYQASSEDLSAAEQLIEEYYTKSVAAAAASLLANDTVMEYPGEAYEDIYLNVFKALNYAAAKDFDGAYVEVQKVNNKLNLLEDKYRKVAEGLNSNPQAKGSIKSGKNEFYNSALAHYLSAVLYRADRQPDNAAIDLRKIDEAFAEEPDVYGFAKPDLSGFLAKADKPRVTIIGLAGKGPFKKAHTYRLNTAPNSIAISEETEDDAGKLHLRPRAAFYFPGIEGGYNFKCQVPYIASTPSGVARMVLLVDGVQAGSLALIEDVNKVAETTFKLREDIIYPKTVIRTVVKGIGAKLAKKGMDEAAAKSGLGLAGALLSAAGGLAADAAVEVSEIADLRSARYLPGQVWAGDFQIEAGAHKMVVEYYSAGGKLLYSDDLGERQVDAKGLNLWSSAWAAY
jgi:hypothetical protein